MHSLLHYIHASTLARMHRYTQVLKQCFESFAEMYKHTSEFCPGTEDWEDIAQRLHQHLAHDSKPVPEVMMVVAAAHFRDPDFGIPDPETDCVLVHGGVQNSYGAAGCHFMPLLTSHQLAQLPKTVPSRTWWDMVMAVASRDGDVTLADAVRDGGDCYFHSCLVAVHFKGVKISPLAMHSSSDTKVKQEPLQSPGKNLTPCKFPSATAGDSAGSPTPSTPESASHQFNLRANLIFDDALEQERQSGSMIADPTAANIEAIQLATNDDELAELLFLDRIFEGLRDKEQVYETVTKWIDAAWKNEENHRTIARNEAVDLRMHTPAPMADAVITVGRAKGLLPETVLAVLEANMGVMEAPGTALTHKMRSNHFISTSQSVTVGSASSTRKSNLIKMSDDWLTNCEDSPEYFRNKDVLCTDSTTKGIRNCLQNNKCAIVSSDEAANTFETPMSDKDAGLHFLSKAKLNTWTQSEYDGPATGQGKINLESYNFACVTVESLVSICLISSVLI